MKMFLHGLDSITFLVCLATMLSLSSMHQKQKTLICSACLDALATKTHKEVSPEGYRERIQIWAEQQGICRDCKCNPKQQPMPLLELKKILSEKGFMVTALDDIALQNLAVYFVYSCVCGGMLYFKIHPDIKYCLVPGVILGTLFFIKSLVELSYSKSRSL